MIIEFDETNFEEVKRVLSRIVKIKNDLFSGQHNSAKLSKKLEAQQKLFESFNKILESNVSSVYGNEDIGEYYVYFHCDPTEPIIATKDAKNLFAAQIGLSHKPFYVGKGIHNRCYETDRNDSYAKKKQQISRADKEVLVVKVKQSINENSALALESKFIDIFGLVAYHPFNWLLNLDEGKYKEERRNKYIKGSKFTLLKNRMILK